jgi:6-phosphofructokinase 1
VVLSHLQRGGTPVSYDRRMGRLFGVAALDLLLKGETGRMVSLRHGEITHVPISALDGAALHLVKVKSDGDGDNEQVEYDVERYNAFRTFDVLPAFDEEVRA